jgi:hypothetical protein
MVIQTGYYGRCREHHHLDLETKEFQDLERKVKKFELRENSNNIKLYDMIYFEETVNGTRTGRIYPSFEIKHILYGDNINGIHEDYCIFSIS